METTIKWMLVWLVMLNVIGMLVTSWDKRRARRREWRVPESTFWMITALGGGLLTFVTMLVIRHKTRHRSLMIGLPLMMLVQVVVFCLLWWTYGWILT